MRPPSGLLKQLGRLRLLGRAQGRSLRQGERRSSAKGAGLEFAGHRPYQEGDDLRHLDTRVYARLRQPFMREFLADRQLRVTILVDASASMNFGAPSKRETALMIAGVLAYAGLASGDLVDIGIAQGDRINWSDTMQGASRADALFRWIETARPKGESAFAEQVQAALPRLRNANVAILLGDWWIASPEEELRGLMGLPGHVFGVQITTPEEDDPTRLGGGPLRLRDAEDGALLDLALDRNAVREYAQNLESHREALRLLMQRLGGDFASLRTDMPNDEYVAGLMRSGLLG